MSSNENQKKISIPLLRFIPAMVLFDPVSEHTSLHSERFNEKHAMVRDPAARGGGEERERGKIYQMAYKERSMCTSQQRIQFSKPYHLGKLPLTDTSLKAKDKQIVGPV